MPLVVPVQHTTAREPPRAARAAKGLFGEALKGGRAAAVITGLAVCPEGLVSACLDGTVRLHPLQ